MNNTITVRLVHSKLWSLANMNQVDMNLTVFKRLRAAGIPVDGTIDMRGVLHGRIVCFNEVDKGERILVYEWTPGPDSPRSIDISDL